MNETKLELLEWLLRPRAKDYPFVTYRGGGVKAEVNLVIPLDDIADYFGVTTITIRGKVWERKPRA